MDEKRLRSFGRMASRMSVADQAKLDARLAPFAMQAEALTAWAGPVEIEIGMGNGLALFARAQADPARLFVGVEVYKNGLRSLAIALEKHPDVRNVRIVNEDARDWLATLPHHSVDRVLVPYPDPWPKAKHNKRRIVNADFLTLVQPILKAQAPVWFISDIPDYVEWTREVVAAHPAFALATDSATPPPWWVTTKYEQKAVKEGRAGQYLQLAQVG